MLLLSEIGELCVDLACKCCCEPARKLKFLPDQVSVAGIDDVPLAIPHLEGSDLLAQGAFGEEPVEFCAVVGRHRAAAQLL